MIKYHEITINSYQLSKCVVAEILASDAPMVLSRKAMGEFLCGDRGMSG
jgi:hypothetical protein